MSRGLGCPWRRREQATQYNGSQPMLPREHRVETTYGLE